jgi:poly(3-hydroxybutyrate) depolymerase
MVHLLACDPEVSTKLAAYAIVAGGFGTKAVAPIWAECKPSRLPAPILEIHGEDDKILPYLLNDWEPAKSRRAVPHWLEDWSERNGCGEAISDPIQGMDGTGTPVTVTKLEGGGWSSEAEAYGGGILRTAKSCPILGEEKAAEAEKNGKEVTETKEEATKESLDDKEEQKEELKGEETLKTDPAHFTLLHYRIRDFGHGWPLQQIKGRKGNKEERMFDTTDLVVDWFNIHKLPEPESAIETGEEKKKSEEQNADVVEETMEDILEPIDIDAAPADEVKSEEPEATPKQERVKQSLEEEDHDEL